MKTSPILLAGVMCLCAVSVRAQFGAGLAGGGVSLSKSTLKLFGEKSAFSAYMEFRTQGDSIQAGVFVPARFTFSEGKSRFEVDLTQAKGGNITPDTGGTMKSLGMEKIIMISRPDLKISYTIYPGLHAYVETPMQGPDADRTESDFNLEATAVGKEAMAGHNCVKSKVVVTDKFGGRYESMVWNATDLDKFPVRIEQTQGNSLVTMTFTDVRLYKPDAAQFNPPANYKKYDSMTSIIDDMKMQKPGGAIK